MRSIFLMLFTLFILSAQSFAAAIQSEFLPTQSMGGIKEGDLFEATLRFWPIENADLGQFKKLEKAVLFNSFYLAQISSLEISANNADVVELKAVFVVKSAKFQPLYAFKYNDSLIEMRTDDIKIEASQDQSQDFYIQDQKVSASSLWMIICGIIILFIVTGLIKREQIKNYLLKIRPDAKKKAIKKYDEAFRKANKREEFERIYEEKNVWLDLLETKSPAHLEFLKVLNQYQYKKEWSNEDYSEVRAAFDVIRRSFEK